MSSIYDKLIFGGKSFQRDTIEARMHEGGFNSISRFELFLWDLEILLQLQKRLGDKVVLKGGAAAQFYIPVEAQRTSVDIDLLFFASLKSPLLQNKFPRHRVGIFIPQIS